MTTVYFRGQVSFFQGTLVAFVEREARRKTAFLLGGSIFLLGSISIHAAAAQPIQGASTSCLGIHRRVLSD